MSESKDPQPAGEEPAGEPRSSPGAPPPPPSPGYQAPPPGYQPPPPGYQPPPPGYQPPSASATPPTGYGPAPYGPYQPAQLRPDEERLWAMLSHLSFFVFGIIVPLIIMLTMGTRSGYVRHHAVEALNFHITVWIASIISGLAFFLVIGIILLPLVLLAAVVFTIIAAVQAYQGVPYRYPLSIRLIS
jgi:uncharacterized Tic20 family protein